MSKKRRNRHKKENQEPRFDFDEAKELTVGQAIRKNEEVEAGVLPEDSILDKYVKQHKDEIEADKFATRQYKKEELVETQSLDDLIQEMREAVEESEASSEEVPSSEDILPPLPLDDEEQGLDPLLLEDENPTEMTEEVEEEQNLSLLEQEGSEKKSKKGFVSTALALVSVIICVSAYYVYRQVNRSTKEIQTAQSSSSEQNVQPILEDFNSQYDAFYTDSNKTALKNSQFDKLSQLKTLLDKLEGSREHALAKSKYDSLATQIKAIQDVNAQFEKPAIVDGVLDTNAKAKSDAKFTDIKTGNTEIDKVLDKAISLGKSQKTSTSSSSQISSSSQASSNSSTESSTSNTSPSSSGSSNNSVSARDDSHGGLSSSGVNLQRASSRVPFNQSAIDDSNNSAWDFADGVLEQILATSRSRGYITGNQYILERVNIVNGNGYYNLYKPDGTYLFTLNCKTGYFVGNGSGHADDLDY
ncbi:MULTISPECIES: cell division site-positioning protein MapZ [Streptococcus]|uniref:cell division site-positioning protein MapZ n=1 Tax=Streptococcus TaxID=1301 RepID=UPI0011061E98|nr:MULTISPECIES: cell division site-positioning protein MapZ family protein [Streptococcus]